MAALFFKQFWAQPLFFCECIYSSKTQLRKFDVIDRSFFDNACDKSCVAALTNYIIKASQYGQNRNKRKQTTLWAVMWFFFIVFTQV